MSVNENQMQINKLILKNRAVVLIFQSHDSICRYITGQIIILKGFLLKGKCGHLSVINQFFHYVMEQLPENHLRNAYKTNLFIVKLCSNVEQ